MVLAPRLDVQTIQISDDEVTIDVDNLGHASTSNASLQFVNSNGEVSWTSSLFSVNASNSTVAFLMQRTFPTPKTVQAIVLPKAGHRCIEMGNRVPRNQRHDGR